MKRFTLWFLVAFLPIVAIVIWATSPENSAQGFASISSLLRLAAMIGLSILLAQYVLTSRAKIIEGSIGQDSLFGYHRWVGRAALSFLFLHFLLLGYRDLASGAGLTLTPGRITGFAILTLLTLTAVSASFHEKLGLKYEWWKGPHLTNYLAFPLVFLHLANVAAPGSNVAYLYFPLLAIFAVLVAHRFVGLYRVRRNRYRVSAVISEAEGIWTLRFDGPEVDYKPGQFMHLQLLRDGNLSSSHPFTISSSPTDPYLSVTPKEDGDFTATVGDTEEGDVAYIDAPYGVFSYLNHEPADRLVFLAGGIGMTPFMSMLRYMREREPDRDVVLLWGNRSEEVTPFLEELEDIAGDMVHFGYHVIMSAQSDWPGERGRIDREMIERYVGELDLGHFYVCGPPPMLRSMLDHLRELGIPGERIHYELFEL